MTAYVVFYSYILVEAAVVGITGVLALRQARESSTIRLCYEIGSVFVGVVWAVQFATHFAMNSNLAGWWLAPIMPVLYWIIIWDKAINAKIRQGSGCLAVFLAYVFFSVYVDIPAGYANRIQSSSTQAFMSFLVLIPYVPSGLGLVARSTAICRHSATPKTGNGDEECGQSVDMGRTQNASSKEYD
jgi:hypothetical protein